MTAPAGDRGTVATTLQMATVVGGRPARCGTVEFAWDEADPLCVTMTFVSDRGRHRRRRPWVVARDLLAAGLTDPAGLGDVTVMPSAVDPWCVELTLSSPDGYRALLLDREGMRDFLAATLRRVPFGAERVDVPDFVPADIEGAW